LRNRGEEMVKVVVSKLEEVVVGGGEAIRSLRKQEQP
jgi:hypothetical protein